MSIYIQYIYLYQCLSIICVIFYSHNYMYIYIHVSPVLNPCVHVKQGAPCKGVA